MIHECFQKQHCIRLGRTAPSVLLFCRNKRKLRVYNPRTEEELPGRSVGGQCHLWTLLLPAPGGIGPRPLRPPGLAAFNEELACRELQSCSSPPAAQMGSFSSPGTSVWALRWDAQPHQTSYSDSTGRDRLIRLLSGNPPCWEPLLTSLRQFLLSSQTQGSVQLLCNSLLQEWGGRWD